MGVLRMQTASRRRAEERLNGVVLEGDTGRYRVTGEWLGGGASAEVFLAVNESTSERVAVKAIDRSEIEASERKKVLLQRELQITAKLRHPNIINLLEVVFNADYVVLILEFAEGGELFEVMQVRAPLLICAWRGYQCQLGMLPLTQPLSGRTPAGRSCGLDILPDSVGARLLPRPGGVPSGSKAGELAAD